VVGIVRTTAMIEIIVRLNSATKILSFKKAPKE
jgi:hypothetical protein